ncbi:PKD1L3 [Branchiostoma lanceolatum]|uniref:PKD1L3 protein n=1 Tax=Branchiostoma lanceolatum TaxID=7740 RepID=A0A8K0EV27_BRALA|nr:PKD1L3 [Branchiostoma lanceolatum]
MKTVILPAILFLLGRADITGASTQPPTLTTTPCPAPGTVKITGDYLRIVGTADEPALFEATLEPNHGCYQGQVVFSWHCRRNASTPLGSSTPVPVAQYRASSVDSSGNNVYTAACGDVDFLELSGAGSAIRLNQSTMDSGATYVIKVNATVGDASVDFAQELHIIDGGPLPVFSIRCRENCLETLKHKELKLEASCETGCTSSSSSSGSSWWRSRRRSRTSWLYRWQLYEENTETGEVTEIPDLAAMTNSGTSRAELKVEKNNLEPGKKYRFRVKGTKSDGSSWSFKEYHVHSPPKYNVNCSVAPKTGFAAGTGFIITADVPDEVTSEEDIDYSFFSAGSLLSEQRSSVAGPYRLQRGDAGTGFLVTIKVQANGDEGFYSECSVNASVLPPVKPPVGVWQDTLYLAYEAELEIDQADAATAATLAVGIVDLLDQVLSADSNPAQTLRDQGFGDLVAEALNSSVHYPSPTAPPLRSGLIFARDWSSGATIDDMTNMLPAGTPGSGETKLQMYVRSNLIDKLSARSADLLDVSSLHQGTDGLVKLLGTGDYVYAESQFTAAESLHIYARNLHEAVLAEGHQIDGDQIFHISEGIHNGLGAVMQNFMDEKGVSRTSSAISWSNMLPTVLGQFEETTDLLTRDLLRGSFSDSPPVVFDLPIGSVLYQKHKKDNIQKGAFAEERSQGFVSLPDSDAVFGNDTDENIINSKFVAFTRNPMTWDPETEPRSSVLSLDFFDETGNRLPVQDTGQPLQFYIQNYDKPGFPNVTFMNESSVADNGVTYHRMDVDNETTPTPVLVMLIPPPHVIAYQVYMQYNEPPTPDNHNFTTVIPPLEIACDVNINEHSGRDVTALFPWVYPEINGSYYIGVKELGPGECRKVPGVSYADVKSKINGAPDDESYSLAILTPQCVWWEKNGEGQWNPSGCTVGPNTTVSYTQCLSTHLTSFGSDFMVPPNSIDFSTVFAKFANLSDNAAVFSTVIVMFGIYFIIIYFLYKADKLDRLKWGVLPIADNNESDEKFYLLTVYTGMKAGSGTSSKAGIILHGADGDTGPRPLAASKNQVFKRGSISSFLLSTSVDLGDLTHLHVWHDNSGAGGDSSWFLDKIVVGDLRSDKRYVFFCQRWLAVEMDDGRVDRFLSAAGRDELTNFSSIFQERTRHDMSDGHLWFSVASRPTRSHFSRVQRASCCLSLVFLTMITNAMFYRTDDSVRQQVYRLGPFVFTPTQLWISAVSTLIVFPANFVIVYVFTKSRPSPGKTKQSSTGSFYKIPSSASKLYRDSLKRQNGKNKQSGLPHWCVYIGWVLVFLSATGSAFFVILYSMEWGAEKSGEWLTSILLSIFQSVLIVQPLKVLLLGLLIAFIFKKLGKAEMMEAGALDDDEEFLPRPMDAKDVRPPAKPVSCRASDDVQLAAARTLRLKEARMRAILWDVFKHFLVVAVVFYIAFSSGATVGYHMHKSLKGRFPTFKKVR